MKRTAVHVTFAGAMLVLFAVPPPERAHADDTSSAEYRLVLAPHHAIHGDLTGFGELGFYWTPERHDQTYTALWPGMTYSTASWVQISAGLRTQYTDNESSADKLELRPFAGAKLFLPNDRKWSVYNYTRYEFRDTQNRDTDAWAEQSRIRSRFALEVPLTAPAKAWKPHTWYTMTNVEPFYRFDEDAVDPLQFRAGIAHILNDGIHLEFFYDAQLTRPTGGGALRLTTNIFTVNVKIGLHQGLLRHLQNPSHD